MASSTSIARKSFNGRLRRYYKLTQAGIAVLDEEVSRMHANVKVAARRLRTLAAGAS